MANQDNLVSLKDRTQRERKEIATKGAETTNKIKRQRKAMREQMEMLLTLPLKDQKIINKFKQIGVDTNDMNNQMALIMATYQKALRGDMQAMNVVRELVGERVQEFRVSASIDDKVQELHSMLDNMKDEQGNS